MRLYRRDREWLKANSPKSLKRTSSVRIDWNKRDEEILAEVTKVVEELLNPENKPVRVTVSKVGYLIGERALLEKKLDKLPLTKSFLHQKVETIEKFQHRRIYYAIKKSRAIGEVLVSWKILRGAGIKDTNKWTEIVNRILADM